MWKNTYGALGTVQFILVGMSYPTAERLAGLIRITDKPDNDKNLAHLTFPIVLRESLVTDWNEYISKYQVAETNQVINKWMAYPGIAIIDKDGVLAAILPHADKTDANITWIRANLDKVLEMQKQ